jgi:predicted AlkP superfamily phosphohydrolase/phosphomutase
MISTRTPLVVIGLDGADWDLINPWIDEGELPNFKMIKKEGISSVMISTIPPITGPALASFFTGLNPDNTGITSFIRADGRLISYNDIVEPTIWDYLGSAGILCCIVGLRLTYPPKEINGIMISGGLLRSMGDDYVKPEKYLDRTRGYHPDAGNYPVLYSTLKNGVVTNPKKFTDELISLTKKQFSIFSYLRKIKFFPFSLFWVENTDLLQHFCWHRPAEILRLYQCIDSLIGEFLGENSNINLMVLSDHGFHASPTQSFYINKWLMERGYLNPNKRILISGVTHSFERILSRTLSPHSRRKLRLLWEGLRHKKSTSVDRGKIGPYMMPLTKAAKKYNFKADSATAYASEPWGVRINAGKGEEDFGHLKEKLISDMKALLDEKGRPVFTLVCPKEKVYSGAYFRDMPDILFLVQSRFHVELYLKDKRFGHYDNPENTTGVHDQAIRGIMTAFGPGINKKTHIKEMRIIDVLPTILDYFNLSPPNKMDGKSRGKIFNIDGQDREKKSVAPVLDSQEAEAYTPEEELEIKKRLEKLGYL